MLTFTLTEELELMRSTARDFAHEVIRPHGRQAERIRGVPAEVQAGFKALGFAGIDVPEEYGGLGLGLCARVIVEEALAYGDIGIAMALASPGPVAEVVRALGTNGQSRDLLPPLILECATGAVAWAEPTHDSDSFATTAVRDRSGGWRLSGTKIDVIGAPNAKVFAVFARTRGEPNDHPAVFIVPQESQDARSQLRVSLDEPGLALAAVNSAEVTLNDVLVSEPARLSGADDRFEAAVVALLAKIGVVGAARAVGLAAAAFDYARNYAAGREAFGKPIAHFQGVAFLFADMATRVEAMRGLVAHAAWAFDHADANAVKLAAMAIAECHEGAMFVSNHAVQLLGGAGFVEDHPVEKWMREAKAHMSYALSHPICDLLIGRMGIDDSPLALGDAPLPGFQSGLL